MAEQKMFSMGDDFIDLSMVIDVARPPNSGGGRNNESWLMVMMQNGCFKTIRGRTEVEAFMQAMAEHLEVRYSAMNSEVCPSKFRPPGERSPRFASVPTTEDFGR